MKRLFRYICYALLLPMLAIATSCTDDSMVPDSLTDLREGMVNVTFTLQFPQATTVATRTMGDMPARNLDLYLFVFDNNVLKQKLYIPASQQNFSTGEVFSTFKADLSTTDGNAVVHLVAIDDPDKVFADALNALELFGTESNVMFNAYFPTTANGQDAYWQRVELGMPITKKGNGEVADEVKAKLQRIPMIRNFAKVSMEDRTNNTFELTGFEVINVRDRGTIVPAFTDGEGNTKFAIFDTQTLGGKDNYYAKILEQGYTGRNAAGAARINDKRTENLPSTATWDITKDPKYIYERQFAATNHIYVIMAGRYNGSQTPTYYKLDIGNTDANNLFTYYNLLRNIDYHFVINSVAGAGYATPAAAAAGAPFNNVSASVELRDMLNVSDGKDFLYVNFTSKVIVNTNDNPIEFRYKYYKNINVDNKGTLSNNAIIVNDAIVGLKAGDVIERYEVQSTDDDDWRVIKIWAKEPTIEVKQQTFTIYDPNGLNRTITLISKTPWKIDKIDTFPGLWSDFDDVPWDWSNEKREIDHTQGAPLTLFFELPENLPESMFPLQFVIESDKQNIENAYVGNAVVQSAPSLFNSEHIRIQYVKTVPYYDYDTSGDNPNASRIVRCRFLTITDLKADNIGAADGTSETRLKVSNPYFEISEDGFTRNSNTSDPTPQIWDFSTPDWASVLTALGTGGSTTAQTFNKLTIRPGNNRMYGYVDDGYILSSSTANLFTFTYSYPGPDMRTAQLIVTAANANDAENGAAVGVSVTATNATVALAENSANNVTAKGSIIYDIKIPSNTTGTTIEIKPNTASMRFYKIEYYPRGINEE